MRLKMISRPFYGNVVFFCLIYIFISINAYGAEIKRQFLSKKDAISITSKKMVLQEKAHLVIFEGDVVVKGRSMTLRAERVEVRFIKGKGDKKREISTITASGHVRLYQANRMVQSDRLVYDRDTDRMVFTGSPHIIEGEDKIYGKKIIVYLTKDKVVVEGGEAVIHPR